MQVRQDKLVGFSNLSRYSSKEVAKYAVELLPCLCEHLEATSAFFQVRQMSNKSNVLIAKLTNLSFYLLLLVKYFNFLTVSPVFM